MTKIQLTLTAQEVGLLSVKANQLGYSLARFIKFLIGEKAEEIIDQTRFPTYKMSPKAQKIALQAKKDYDKGKATEITDFAKI